MSNNSQLGDDPQPADDSQAPPADDSQRTKIIEAVRTPLGIFTLIVLVVEGVLGAVTATGGATDPNRTLLISSMIGIIVLLIVTVGVIAFVKPEALWGKRYSALEDQFADSLGKDIFEAWNPYLANDQTSRLEAYNFLQSVLEDSMYYAAPTTKRFTQVLIGTLVKRAQLRDKRPPAVLGVVQRTKSPKTSS